MNYSKDVFIHFHSYKINMLTFHGLRIPVKKFGNSSGRTTASLSNFFASSSSAMSFLKIY